MRPIKFRVWCPTSKHFSTQPWLSCDGLMLKWEHTGDQQTLTDIKLDNYVIQQYTGLKDKNDKEIYEGDILDIFNHSQPEEIIYCSSETAFGFFAHEEKERQNGRFESLGDYTSPSGYTVIGNIFENQELLDKTKEL